LAARDLRLRRHTQSGCAHGAQRRERDVALQLLARCERRGGETVLGDKGYVGAISLGQ
jgi:hypothetical protein